MAGRIRYKVDVYSSGVQSTTGAIAFTLQTSQLAAPPVIGGQYVRAAEGRVESQPSKLRILDANSTFTAHLANSSGRLNLLGRLTRIRSSLDSTASYTNLTVGRVTDIGLNKDVATWDVTVQDERFLERDARIFAKANTCTIIPRGVVSAFQGHAPAETPLLQWRVQKVLGNLTELTYAGHLITLNPRTLLSQQVPGGAGAVGLDIPQFVIDDLKVDAATPGTGVTKGNFQTIRWRNTGNATDYEIAAFGWIATYTGDIPPIDVVGYWRTFNESSPTQLRMWVVWVSSPPAQGATVTGYLYAPLHVPTATLPLHIGGSGGVHPFKLAQDIYQGVYNTTATGTLKLRISTAQFTKLQQDASYGLVWFRITSPQSMGAFLDDRIYKPYGVAPLLDSSGRIVPTPMRLPASADVPASLPIISSTVAITHPTWEQPSREAITALRLSYETYSYQRDKDGRQVMGTAADGLDLTIKETTRLHDNTTRLGRKELAAQLGAVSWLAPPMPYFDLGVLPAPQYMPAPQFTEMLADTLAKSLFARFGDGPLYASVDCLRSIDATTSGIVQPGQFVKLNIGTWPNPNINARGGVRLMQVVQRQDTPVGPSFRLLDVGSSAQALAAPTVTLALTGGDTRHGITATIASVPVGARWEAHIALTTSTGGTRPNSSSPRWMPAGTNTTGTLTLALGHRASHTKFFGRVRAYKAGRITSPWSTASASVVTASITAPSGATVANISAGVATLRWTNGSSLYGLDVMIDASSGAALGTSRRIATAPALTTRYVLRGLNAGAKHKVGVRHRDPFGGVSGISSFVFTATTTFTQAPAMRGLAALRTF